MVNVSPMCGVRTKLTKVELISVLYLAQFGLQVLTTPLNNIISFVM